MEVGEREAAPGRAECAEPGDAVDRIEEGAGQGEGVEDFRTGRKFFKVDGAEGDTGRTEGLGDGGEGVAGAAQDGYAVLLTIDAGLLDPVGVALDEGDDFFNLGRIGFVVGLIRRCCVARKLWAEVNVKFEV